MRRVRTFVWVLNGLVGFSWTMFHPRGACSTLDTRSAPAPLPFARRERRGSLGACSQQQGRPDRSLPGPGARHPAARRVLGVCREHGPPEVEPAATTANHADALLYHLRPDAGTASAGPLRTSCRAGSRGGFLPARSPGASLARRLYDQLSAGTAIFSLGTVKLRHL